LTVTELATQRIGFLGAGAMGEALAGGLLAAGVPRERVRAADPDAHAAKRFRAHWALRAATTTPPSCARATSSCSP